MMTSDPTTAARKSNNVFDDEYEEVVFKMREDERKMKGAVAVASETNI